MSHGRLRSGGCVEDGGVGKKGTRLFQPCIDVEELDRNPCCAPGLSDECRRADGPSRQSARAIRSLHRTLEGAARSGKHRPHRRSCMGEGTRRGDARHVDFGGSGGPSSTPALQEPSLRTQLRKLIEADGDGYGYARPCCKRLQLIICLLHARSHIPRSDLCG